MSYHFNEIEAKWQKYWAKKKTFKATNTSEKPKYYVLDMFPYPSGAGLHVGHPLGYIASDIYARYKRHKGFNVLHPQGYDSFGLPAEQYAIQTGQHPAITTEANIKTYRRQLDQLGFSFDWSREVRTSDPSYYKWTQWIFTQLFNAWYNKDTDKAEDIKTLIALFKKEGNTTVNASADAIIEPFTAKEWKAFSEIKKQEILLKYRLTFLSETEVNWCPALGTVLANDEIVNGVSERGGHPVVRKKMKQWSMRISAYAQRLLDGLNTIDWPQPLKDIQTNWIGRSEGAMVSFPVIASTQDEETKKLSYKQLEALKEIRLNTPKAEKLLWNKLKDKKGASKFRHKYTIGTYMSDFVCVAKNTIVEISGKEDETARTAFFEQGGYSVVRFTNEEILKNVDAVLAKINTALQFPAVPKATKKPASKVAPINEPSGDHISVFTTRPDTIFGVSFMTLAPEHELVSKITTAEQKAAVKAYVDATAKRSERDRMADVKTISGVFTGAYALHPFSQKKVPIWIGDYVLASYGTGAVMAVPCGDQRDYEFAKHFDLEIPNIFKAIDISEEAFADKESTVISNSDFLNDLPYKKAMKTIIYEIEKRNLGYGKINYRLRDAVFSRQRYWGEPFPVYYKNGMPQMIDVKHLPIVLPEVEKYLPTEDGKPPLGNAEVWAWCTETNTVVDNSKIDNETVFPLELNTMPGWAGSSQYFNRYMDPNSKSKIFSKKAIDYWQDVDLYIGGSEHATGHLLYSRFWQKFMFDKGLVPKDEFAKKLINQGMITGTSAFVKRIGFKFDPIGIGKGELKSKKIEDIAEHSSLNHLTKKEKISLGELEEKYSFIKDYFFSEDLMKYFKASLKNEGEIKMRDKVIGFLLKDVEIDLKAIGLDKKVKMRFDMLTPILKYKTHVPIEFVNSSDELNTKSFENWREEYENVKLITDKNKAFKVSREIEKMSKSKYNVVNPDNICKEYGADSLRLYEMFLGPLEQSKPWNTAGITGVHSFLKKLWKLYHNEEVFSVSDAKPTSDNLKTLHKTVKKVEEDIENFSFNTSVSTFMIAVNELTAQKCTSKEILEPLLMLISPYAPHIAEELWNKLGHKDSIAFTEFPTFDASHLVESTKNYPISFNGKMRFTMELSLDLTKDQIEEAVMAHEKTQAQLEGRTPKKVIIIPGKIVNIVG